jgi:PAS domain S-box-containing protein
MTAVNDNSDGKNDRALLSWIQQLAPYGVFTLDESLRILSWNVWMESHSSLPWAKARGRHVFEIFPELEERKLATAFLRALEGESSLLSTALHHFLISFKSALSEFENGLMRQTARISPLIFEGDVCGVIVVIEDVTQRENQTASLARRHRREEALSWALIHLLKSDEPRKTVRQLFFKIAEHLDFDTFFLYLREVETGFVKLYAAGGVSDQLQKQFLEYDLLAGVADTPEPVILNNVKVRPEPRFALLKEAKISAAIIIPLRVNEKSLGSLCFASWNRDHITTEDSELLATIAQYLATAVDKDNTNKALHRMDESNRWMKAIVESTDDAIISKDLDGIIKSCNQGAARLFGYEIHELVGRPMRMLIPENLQNEETEILKRIREGKRIEHFESVRRRKDGSLIEVSIVISPVIDAAGNIMGASQIARNITDRRHAEQKLAESFQREKLAREKAESANRAKDDFLASLSHELRTPLNPILLIASDASENPDLSPDVKGRFETIRKNIELEARLIDDLLDITRIAHGKLSLHLRVVDLKTILEETIRNVQSELNEKLIEFRFDFGSSQRYVRGDDVRLQQVFWNILKNAVKFTPSRGRIALSVEAVENRLQISVTDTGIGIATGEIGRIFEAFSQGDHVQNEAHRFGGLGLGLAIARKLIEMHHGRIEVFSDGLHKGSTFTVQLPVAEPEKLKSLLLPPSTEQQTGMLESAIRILLVEDHEPTRTTLTHLLSRRGFKVVPAASALEARQAAETQKIDIVISDVGLPDGNGNELMMHLHTTFGLKGIAMTGYGMEEDIEKCLASGFVTHLIKPVNIRALENTLKSMLAQR